MSTSKRAFITAWIRRAGRSGAFAVTSCLLAVIFGSEVIHLVRVNQGLAEEYRSAFQAQSTDLVAKVGDKVIRVTGFSLAGQRTSVTLTGSSRSLVFGVSSQCPACLDSVPSFRRLTESALSRKMRVIVVSKDTLDGNEVAHRRLALSGVLIVEPTHATYTALKLTTVPQALIISREGRIEVAVTGRIDGAKENRLLAGM